MLPSFKLECGISYHPVQSEDGEILMTIGVNPCIGQQFGEI